MYQNNLVLELLATDISSSHRLATCHAVIEHR